MQVSDTVADSGSPRISVIIPAYNSEQFVRETLVSVLRQSYQDFEVIVVDDGSTDATAAIVKEFSRVRYFYQTNRGPACARNVGLSLARGCYVVFMDSDDVWHPDMLGSCVGVLDQHRDVGAVHTNWTMIDEQGKSIVAPTGWQAWRGHIFDCLVIDIPFINCSILWRHRFWDEIGGFDATPEMNDDWINWLRIARLGCVFECIERPLAYYRMHNNNLTLRQGERILKWRLNALDRICLECHDIPPAVRGQAYGKLHFMEAIQACQLGKYDQGIQKLKQAVLSDPGILGNDSTYFELASLNLHYRNESSRAGSMSVRESREHVELLVNGLFALGDLPDKIRVERKSALSLAFLALARLAYASGSENAMAARYLLWRALAYCPSRLLNRTYLGWCYRIGLGKKLIGSAKSSRLMSAFSHVAPARER